MPDLPGGVYQAVAIVFDQLLGSRLPGFPGAVMSNNLEFGGCEVSSDQR